MKPLSLRLKHFKGIREGLGIEEITLDLSRLTGLVALIGDNGAGKTTVLDNCHPYRFMPSKTGGQYAPGSFSFYDDVCGLAEKELIFEMDGEKWRSLLIIDRENKKQEAYLFVEKNGEWLTKNKSGKVSAYDKVIEEIVGPARLFFNSIFRCQEAPRLNTYRKGVIKDILADLLLLDNIKDKGKTAKAVVDSISKQLELAKVQESIIGPEANKVSSLTMQLSAANENLLSASRKLETEEAAEKVLLYEMQALAVEIASFSSTEQSRKKTADRVRIIEQLLVGICDKRIAMEDRQYQRYQAYLQKRTRLGKILANGSDIRKKVGEEQSSLKKRDELEGSLKTVRDDIQQKRKIADQIAGYKDQLASLQIKQTEKMTSHKGKIAALASEITRIEVSVKRLDGLPCTEDLQNACAAVKATVADKKRLIIAKTELEELRGLTGEDAVIAQQIGDINAKIVGLQNKTDTREQEIVLIKLEAEIGKVKGALSGLSKWTKLLPDLETAERSLIELKEEISSTITSHVSELTANMLEEDEVNEELTTVKGALADLDITLMGVSEVVKNKSFVDAKLAEVQKRVQALRRDLMTVNGQHARLKESLHNAMTAADKLVIVRNKLAAMQEQRDLWAVIERGFSNDGIISLEIDEAGPEISRIATDLLSSSFGSQYSVRINTQGMKADGKMAESFDISVISNDSGESASLSDKSGGQKTWIEDAVTKSIALFNVDRAGKRFHTLFTDERDGALDQQSKREFFILKKKALAQGGFANEFFISHSSQSCDMADHRLVFQKGVGVAIE